MSEKLKTLKTYEATWKRIKLNPTPYFNEHIRFQSVGKPIPLTDGVFKLGTSARSCSSYKTFRQSVHELDVQIARRFLETFIHVNQCLPKKGEKCNCTIRLDVSIISHKRSGEDSTILITGEMLPKV